MNLARSTRWSSHRRTEHEWCRRNRALLDVHVGEWVALEGETIVAHGAELLDVVERARCSGIVVPYVFRVEPPDDRPRLGL